MHRHRRPLYYGPRAWTRKALGAIHLRGRARADTLLSWTVTLNSSQICKRTSLSSNLVLQPLEHPQHPTLHRQSRRLRSPEPTHRCSSPAIQFFIESKPRLSRVWVFLCPHIDFKRVDHDLRKLTSVTDTNGNILPALVITPKLGFFASSRKCAFKQ
jgi:hypothetical protein